MIDQSKESAREIIDIANRSLTVASRAGENFEQIVPGMEQTARLVKNISNESYKQSVQIEQFKNAIEQVSQLVQTTASSSEELSAMSEKMLESVKDLKESVDYFKIDLEGLIKNRNNANFEEYKDFFQNKIIPGESRGFYLKELRNDGYRVYGYRA